jgi:hypothetical protein
MKRTHCARGSDKTKQDCQIAKNRTGAPVTLNRTGALVTFGVNILANALPKQRRVLP